jgi:phosphate:Na+ symporter
VCLIIKPKKTEEEDEFRLTYIRGGLMKTPEISVLQAQKEIAVFGDRMQRMFGMVREMVGLEPEDAEFQKLFDRVEKYENISDNMENEIGRYLGLVGEAHLSDDTKGKIRGMLRQIGELESIGDSCFNLARIIRRARENKPEFTETQTQGVHQMMDLVDKALTQMNLLLTDEEGDGSIAPSEALELEINQLRNSLKDKNMQDMDNHVYSYGSGSVYMDFISECEKNGDYIINVVQANAGVAE